MKTRPQKRKVKLLSSVRKGELTKCSLCRFYPKGACILPGNKIEIVEEKQGHCVYFTSKKY